jgi:transcriptional regulator with PAS, ATPase and Fis domain
LRERGSDVPSLAWTFIERFSAAFDKKIEGLSSRSLDDLQQLSGVT